MLQEQIAQMNEVSRDQGDNEIDLGSNRRAIMHNNRPSQGGNTISTMLHFAPYQQDENMSGIRHDNANAYYNNSNNLNPLGNNLASNSISMLQSIDEGKPNYFSKNDFESNLDLEQEGPPHADP